MTSNYETLDIINDPDGVSVEITRRQNANGLYQHSYRFFRTFEGREGEQRTPWMHPRHIPAMLRLTAIVDERLKLEADRAPSVRRRRRQTGLKAPISEVAS